MIEKGIKIFFVVFQKTYKYFKSKKVILTYHLAKNKNWRINYEKNNFNSKKFFNDILKNIFKKFSNQKNIYIDGYLPVPFYVILGVKKALLLITKNDKEKLNFKKLKIKNNFKLIKNKLVLVKKQKISKIPNLLILESKNTTNEKYDFLIKPKKNKFKRNSISIHSLKKQIKKFMSEINDLNGKRRVNYINVSIVASPQVCFLVGHLLAKENFIFKIYHFSQIDKKNILKAQIGPDMKFDLF